MTPDYKALCAELADDLEPWITYGEIEAIEKSHDLIDRARAALAAQPRPQPVPEGPSDQEIEEWAAASSVPGEFLDPDSGRWERCLSSEEFCATVRAALARWGHAPNA